MADMPPFRELQTTGDLEHAVRESFDRSLMRFGMRRETPQVLLTRAAQVVWSASHGGITLHTVRTALAAYGSGEDAPDERDPDEAPETPTDEPPPTPVQDPPSTPDKPPPYVVC